MKITYLHQYFNTPSMSGGTRSYEMAKRLVAMGHEVTMITSWRESTDQTDWFITNEGGFNVHWLPIQYSNHMSYSERIKAFFKFALLSAKRVANIETDVIFATSTPLTISFPAVYAARKMKKPMVFEVRDLWPELPIAIGAIKNPFTKFIAKRLEIWSYRNSESVIALSPGMRDGVSSTGYPVERIAIIPNSCDNNTFDVSPNTFNGFRKLRPWLGNKPLLIYPGTLGIINGVSYLVDIAKILKEVSPDVRILIIGDGIEREKIVSLAKSEGVLNVNFFIENKVSKSEIPAIFASADIICSLFLDLPEMRSNSANKFFDTLAAGKPCLLNYGGWQSELVNKSNCGLVTWRMTAEQAARSISKHITDKSWLIEAGNNAKKIALEQFDRDVLAAQLATVLELSNIRRGHDSSSVTSHLYD